MNTAVSSYASLIAQGNESAKQSYESIYNDYIAFKGFPEDESAIVSAAIECNAAGVGVMEYLVVYTGTNSTYEYTLSLGFTEESLTAVEEVTMEGSDILF